MIELTFRSGRTLAYRRTDMVDVLRADNSHCRQPVLELSPGVLIVGLGMIVWMTTDGERRGLPERDVTSLPVRRVEAVPQ